ncbi:unnamed protein product, partial [Amoebophrya sp. A25]
DLADGIVSNATSLFDSESLQKLETLYDLSKKGALGEALFPRQSSSSDLGVAPGEMMSPSSQSKNKAGTIFTAGNNKATGAATYLHEKLHMCAGFLEADQADQGDVDQALALAHTHEDEVEAPTVFACLSNAKIPTASTKPEDIDIAHSFLELSGSCFSACPSLLARCAGRPTTSQIPNENDVESFLGLSSSTSGVKGNRQIVPSAATNGTASTAATSSGYSGFFSSLKNPFRGGSNGTTSTNGKQQATTTASANGASTVTSAQTGPPSSQVLP